MTNNSAKKTGAGLGIGCLLIAILLAGSALILPVVMVTGFSGAAKNGSGTNNDNGLQCQVGDGPNVVSPDQAYTGEWLNPLKGKLTSSYGGRVHPVLGIFQVHSGQDISAPDGTPILAVADGVASIAGKSTGGNSGYMVAIDHGGGVQSRYVHSWPKGIHVKVGEKVQKGQHISDVGASGNATGPHLHFEIRINGQPTPPVPWMKKKGVNLGIDETQQVQTVNNQEENPDSPKQEIPETGGGLAGTYRRADGQKYVADEKQAKNLAGVISAVRKLKGNDRAVVITLMTVLQESKGKILANTTVPESLGYPNDGSGHDHDSVGLFQQRPSQGWGPVKSLMQVEYSTEQFIKRLFAIKNWEQIGLGEAAQAVQVSKFPDLYDNWEPVATQMLKGAPGGEAPINTECPAMGATTSLAAGSTVDLTEVRSALVDAAKEGLGGSHVRGGREFKKWDDDGFVYWATQKAEIRGVPYVDPWAAGRQTDDLAPGDLIVMGKVAQGKWDQVGIMIDQETMVTVTNKGTIEVPLPKNPVGYSLIPESATPIVEEVEGHE